MSSPACTNTASTIPTFSGQLSACKHARRRNQSHTSSLFIAGARKVWGLTQHVEQQVCTIGKIHSYLQKSMASWRRECRQTRFTVLLQTEEDTVSQTVWGPKMIDNRKLASKKTVVNNKQQDLRSEAEVLVSSLDVQQRSVCERQLVAQHAQWSQWILCGGKFSSSHRRNIWTPHIPTKRL